MGQKIEVSDAEYMALMMTRELRAATVGADKTREGSTDSRNNELENKIQKLQDRHEELHQFLQFISNHENHDIYLHSYTKEDEFTEGKGIEFKGQLYFDGMKALLEHLIVTVEKDIETMNKELVRNEKLDFRRFSAIEIKLGGE